MRVSGVVFALVVLFPGLSGGATFTLQDEPTADRVLAPGEIHTYDITIAADGFARFSVEAHLPHVRMVLLSSDGKEIANRARSNVNNYAETISVIAQTAGQYRLIVESKWSRAGRYTVRLLEFRPAQPADRGRVEAETSFIEARQLLRQGDPQSVQRALVALERALALFHELRDDGAVADTENEIGSAYNYYLGDPRQALPHLLVALGLRQCLPDASALAMTLDYLGDSLRVLGEMRKAITFYEAALPRKNPEIPREVAISLRNLAMTHDDMGDEEALPQFRRLLEMMREAGEPIGVGFVHHSIATHFFNRDQFQDALEHSQHAIRAWREAKYRNGEAYALMLIGLIHESRGEPERALTYYTKALEVPDISNARVPAEATWRISNVYQAMGQFDRAIDQQQQALKAYRQKGDRMMEPEVLRSLGTSYAKKGELERALQYLTEALPISQEVNYPTVEGSVLVELAAVQFQLGKSAEARQSASRAIDVYRVGRSEAGEAAAHLVLARIERVSGDLDTARAAAETAITLTEKVRGNIATPETRATFVASVWETYEFYIDLLMELSQRKPGSGFDALALRASEQVRARSLVDLLAESRMGEATRGESARLGSLRSLRERISAKAQVQLKLAGRSSADAEGIKRELEDLNAQYEQLVARIRRDDPVLAAVASPEPLELSQIQREVLDRSTVLLEYSLGEKRSFLWVVTPEKLFSYELPSRERVESAVRAAYRDVSVRGEESESLAAVSRMVLAPAGAALRAKRLIIVPDGAMHYLPFAALPSPDSGRPLVAEHEIVTLPSASTIAVLRRRPRQERSTKTLAVFADPVFDRDDSRFTARIESPASFEGSRGHDDEMVESELVRSARESGLSGLPRLPFTRREATAVLSLVPPSQRKEALDFAANRRAVLRADLRNYRFVHFATHGLLNNFHPELSGIVLSMIDEQGREQDGFFSTADVFNLSLTADLVVLSGCRTGLGKEIRGDGIAGLTRAFMYAGAPRVVASLWNVNDAATAELMKRFYQGMLGPDRLSPPAALRAAQLSLQKEKRWSAPYYWAAFVIQGEWN